MPSRVIIFPATLLFFALRTAGCVLEHFRRFQLVPLRLLLYVPPLNCCTYLSWEKFQRI